MGTHLYPMGHGMQSDTKITHIQILENENHTSLADFNNNEVWILNCNSIHIDDRIINCSFVTDMDRPLSYKLPLLLQEIITRHRKNFTYEVI